MQDKRMQLKNNAQQKQISRNKHKANGAVCTHAFTHRHTLVCTKTLIVLTHTSQTRKDTDPLLVQCCLCAPFTTTHKWSWQGAFPKIKGICINIKNQSRTSPKYSVCTCTFRHGPSHHGTKRFSTPSSSHTDDAHAHAGADVTRLASEYSRWQIGCSSPRNGRTEHLLFSRCDSAPGRTM